ncbi:hypothetical protein VYU27_008687 [Nannochloropsis oceanica]
MNSLADSLVWEHPQQDRLRLNSIIFFIAFLWSAGTGLSSKLKGRARIAYTACCIHAIAGTSYFLMVRQGRREREGGREERGREGGRRGGGREGERQ